MPSNIDKLDKLAADALEQALELMNNSGAHWVKNTFHRKNDDGEMAYCSIGALHQIRHGWATNAMLKLDDPVIVRAAQALDAAYRPQFPRASSDDADQIMIRVEDWNDRDTTTWTAVVRRFKRARRRLLGDM